MLLSDTARFRVESNGRDAGRMSIGCYSRRWRNMGSNTQRLMRVTMPAKGPEGLGSVGRTRMVAQLRRGEGDGPASQATLRRRVRDESRARPDAHRAFCEKVRIRLDRRLIDVDGGPRAQEFSGLRCLKNLGRPAPRRSHALRGPGSSVSQTWSAPLLLRNVAPQCDPLWREFSFSLMFVLCSHKINRGSKL